MTLSRFAGQYRASDFAYGAGNVAPLVVVAAPGASGAQTVTVQNGWVTLSDGTQISPLATTAPIQIGSAGNAETVTPSAVSNNVQSNLYGPTATATATFSNAHYPGDRISSGTAGLQEALNYASLQGGGTVIIDPLWVTLGGTQAILNAATVPTNVALLDNRYAAAPVQTIKVPLTSAQIKTLFSAPTAVLAAPGAGAAYDILDAFLDYAYGTTQYAAGGAIQLSYGTGVTTPATATVAATFLTSPTASQAIKVAGALASSLLSAVANKAIYIAAATADFTTGDGTINLIINYRTLNGLA